MLFDSDSQGAIVWFGDYEDGKYKIVKTLRYTETIRQVYTENNCIFSGGFVEGHPHDTLYIKMERDGEDTILIHLRPDEMAVIGWIASGVLWSDIMGEMLTQNGEKQTNS